MSTLTTLHSLLRYAVLIIAIYAIIKAFMGMSSKAAFTNSDAKAGTFLTIAVDIQLLIGLVLYFNSGLGLKNIQDNGMGFVMKDGFARFFAIEHLTGMLIAIVLFHIGKAKTKKGVDDSAKHKSAFWFYLIGLIVMLASIPWPFRKGFEALGWY